MILKDKKYQRKISYIRISVTDKCNLRCFYCMPEAVPFIHHNDIITYEEIMELIKIFQKFEVKKIRFTGGEPFVRKGFINFIGLVSSKFPEIDFRITTNATLLDKDKIEKLKSAGIKNLNISLDGLNKKTFEDITKRDLFHKVIENINLSIQAGLNIKINVVALKTINSDQIKDFLEFAKKNPIELRFIEFMPVGENTKWAEKFLIGEDEILNTLKKYGNLREIKNIDDYSTAKLYEIENGIGKIGLISSMTHHFCKKCNRLRITQKGNLRTCLFSDKEYKLLPILRNSKVSNKNIETILKGAVAKKDIGSVLLSKKNDNTFVCKNHMSCIGG